MSSMTRSFNARAKTINWVKLIACLGITMALGQLSMWLSGASNGYIGMNISTVTPPPYLMGIVWSTVYLILGGSLYLVLNQQAYTIRSQNLKNASITLYVVQFAMLLVLPFLLFSQNLFMLTFVVTSLITALTAALTIINLKISVGASLLLLPYLIWMFFETYLSLVIVLNNF